MKKTIPEPSVIQQGGMIRFEKPEPGRKAPPVKRGTVGEFSPQSRRRLMRWLASRDWDLLAAKETPIHFITLTTTTEHFARPAFCYRALRRFHDVLASQASFLGAVFKREYGSKNGALHYHGVVFGVEPSDFTTGHLRDVWTRCMRWTAPPGAKLSTLIVDVEEVKDAQRVAKYISKYCAKIGYEGMARKQAEGTGEGAPGCPGDRGGAPSPVRSLSNAHNVGNDGNTLTENYEDEHDSQGYNGSRYWYVWGDVPEGEGVEWLPPGDELKPGAIKKFATRIRRVFRKWREVLWKAAMRKALREMSYFKTAPADCERQIAKAFTREKRKRFSKEGGQKGAFAFLNGNRGFTLLAEPKLLDKCVKAAYLKYETT